MKPKYSTLTLIIIALVVAGCRSCSNVKDQLKSSIIELDTAILFRSNFVNCPNQEYHIPEALMFETAEFEALLAMDGVDKIRLYPAINTKGNPDDDSLTFIMVPVNGGDNTDNLSLLFEYAEPCPYNCNTPSIAPAQAPTEEVLQLNIPNNWCITAETINRVLAEAADKVGADHVYGIRFYRYNNANNIMDIEIKPTMTDGDGNITNIEGLSYKGITEICTDGQGCCDTHSSLYRPTAPGKR